MFVPPDWVKTLPEADILKIEKDFFTDLPLVHVGKTVDGEAKSDAMARIFSDFLKPAPVVVTKKKSNRKGK
jgi:hypothetical protein